MKWIMILIGLLVLQGCSEQGQPILGATIVGEAESTVSRDVMIEASDFPVFYRADCGDFTFNITFDVEPKANGLYVPLRPYVGGCLLSRIDKNECKSFPGARINVCGNPNFWNISETKVSS